MQLTDRAVARLSLWALVAVAGLVLLIAYEMSVSVRIAEGSAGRRIASLTEMEEFDMRTTWKYYIVEGVKADHTITTSKLESETNDEWVARHAAIVDAAKAVFVPVN